MDAEFNRDGIGRSVGGHRIRFTTEEVYDVPREKRYSFVLKQGNADFYTKNKRKTLVSDSAAQSEFAEFHQCTRSMLWLRNFLKFLQFDQEKPSIIFADSSTGIDVATNPGSANKRSKHWNPKFFLVKEAQENGDIDLHKIPGPENPADATTKPLPETPHEMHLANSGYVTMVPKEGIEGVFMVCHVENLAKWTSGLQ